MKKVAVVLSGCGVFDGAEIHESVLVLLALDRLGAEVHCFAPDVQQAHVVNHLTGAEMPESRNVLVESARIARGQVQDVAQGQAADFDALIFPGGFGAAKNLCNFAFVGPEAEVQPEVATFIQAMHAAGKPLGFCCISPAVAVKALGNGVELTIGNDADTAAGLEKMGARHVEQPVTGIHVDATRKVVSTPAYMYHARLSEVATGIEKLVEKVLELA